MTPEMLRLLILIAVFASVLLLSERVISYLRASSSDSSAINKRLRLIARGVSREDVTSILRRPGTQNMMGLPDRFSGPITRIEQALSGAGLAISPAQLLSYLSILTILIFAAVIGSVFYFGSLLNSGKILLAVTFSIALGMGLPLMILSQFANRRRRLMIEQFPIALDVFVRGLRAGHPVSAALELLTTEMNDPIGSEFGIATDEVTYGAELRDALQDMADRCGLEDMQMFVVSLAIQAETGGNLAEILENLSQIIRERAHMMLKVRALSSEGRMTALILTALPVVSFVGLFVSSPSFYLDVAEDPYFIPGFAILLVGFGIGLFWIRKLIDLKV